MLKAIARLEVVVACVLLALAFWPFSPYCSGRWLDLDCESRAIFGVNLVAPIGVLLLGGGLWSLARQSVVAQWVLAGGVALVIGRLFYYLVIVN